MCRVADDDGVRRYRFSDNRTSTDNDVVADFNTQQNDATHAYKYVITDLDLAVSISSAKQGATTIMGNELYVKRDSNIVANFDQIGLSTEVSSVDVAIFTDLTPMYLAKYSFPRN
ncbi:MAG TPA: hypothetical protein VK014_16300 [Cyclobacteriaceae bacterium]|nr:hypothetical protein [Cyclobacteriaceae bacterium]